MKKILSLSLMAVALLISGNAEAKTITVGTSGAGYTDLASAVTNASAGDTIQFLTGVDFSKTVTINKSLTIDLNGQTLSSTGKYNLSCSTANGNYTIKNGTIYSGGATYALYIYNKAGITVNLENVEINTPNYDYPVCLSNSDTLNIDKDCVLKGKTYSIGVSGGVPTINNYATLTQKLNVNANPSLTINNYGVIPEIYLSANNAKNHTINNYAGGQFTFKVSNKSFTTGQITLHNEGTMDIQTITPNMVITGNGTFKLVAGSYVNIDLPAATYVDLAEGIIIAATDKEDVGVAPAGLKWVDMVFSGGNVCKLVDENAEPVCQIGTNKYYSVKDAVAAVPNTGVQKTIEMIDNEIIAEIGKNYVTIASGQNIILDLKGFLLQGTSTCVNANTCLIKIAGASNGLGFATLIIQDTEAPSDPKLGTGKICYIHNATDNQYNFGNSTILNYGTCIVKSGIVALETPAEYEDVADYVIDMDMRGGYGSPIVGTIEGGYISSTLECFRCYGSSKTSLVTLNLKGGEYFGASGIIFTQASAGTSLQINVTDGKFICDNDDMALVRVYVSNPDESANQSINISGGIANVDAIRIQISTKQKDIIENVRKNTESHLADVFNITGGTFASENYQIKCTHIDNQYQIVEVTNVSDYILPTLLDGATLKDDPTNYLEPDVEEEDRTYPDEITIVHLDQLEPANKDELISQSDNDHAAIINQDITLEEGDTVNAYHVTVKSGADLVVKDGAVVRTDDGGVKIEEGGKITVEAGGTLIVGARGLKTANVQSLYVTCTTEKSGVVVFSPEALPEQNPQVVVKMESNARRMSDANAPKEDPYSYYYQQFGIPTTGDPNITWNMTQAPTGFSTYNDGWLSVSNVHTINAPFKGYEMFSYAEQAGTVYTMSGYLNSKEDATVVLANPGWNFFANSYMAPMDIEAFFDGCYDEETMGDDVDLQITIFKGYTNQYESVVLNDIKDKMSGLPFTSIAPMQGFWMYLNGTNPISFKFKYADCVWGHENVNPMLAPSRKNASTSTRLQLTINAGDFQDAITLTEDNRYSDVYDNGADARKMMNPTFNIYANVEDNEVARVATNNLNGTQLAFQAGNAVEYTMTFSNRNNDNFVLVDNANGAQVAMTEGATYTFVATPNSTDANRFEIRKITNVVTNNEEVMAAPAAKKGIYSAAGQFMGDAKAWNSLPAGMYIVDGVRMAK